MTILFLAIFFSKNIHYVLPIEVDVCTNKNISPNILFQFFWMSIHFLEIILLIIVVFKLRHIRDEFNISNELCTVGLVWMGFEILFMINNSYSRFLDENVIFVLDMMRNYIIIIVSGLLPVIKSFQTLNLPICTTKECAANFNLLLMTEKTYDAFYDYLKSYMPEGAKFLSFWTELNVFKHSKKNNEKNSSTNLLSTDIYQKYLVETSDTYIDFPPQLIEKIHKSYKNSPKDIYSDVFDSLGEFVFNTLRDYYYPNFKMSVEYRKLEGDLEKDEIIYSRLVASSMISSLEIE
jgi:hypothetical protein